MSETEQRTWRLEILRTVDGKLYCCAGRGEEDSHEELIDEEEIADYLNALEREVEELRQENEWQDGEWKSQIEDDDRELGRLRQEVEELRQENEALAEALRDLHTENDCSEPCEITELLTAHDARKRKEGQG